MAKQPFHDIELMQYADDELPAEQAARLAEYLASEEGAEARAKMHAMDQMSDLVSSYLELEADAVEPRLDAMWEVIEQRTRAVEPARVAAEGTRDPRPEPRGVWAAVVRFFEGYRGYILTGAVAAGAAAAIILALRPPQEVIVERPVALREPHRLVPGDTQPNTPPAPDVHMVADEPNAPTVEELDVTDGSAMIFMMPGESEDDVSATVIYVDFNNIEGPL